MTQFHFDRATYAAPMRAEVPAYGRLQQAVGLATAGRAASELLDLGTGTRTGTGETLARLSRPTGSKELRPDPDAGCGPLSWRSS
jgi:hypothetical protein